MATFQTVTVKAEQGFQNRLTGRANSSAVFLLNAAGDVAFLPGSESPYSPIGGRRAFASCIAQGCLVFKPYAFPAGVSVGKPIKLNAPGNAPG